MQGLWNTALGRAEPRRSLPGALLTAIAAISLALALLTPARAWAQEMAGVVSKLIGTAQSIQAGRTTPLAEGIAVSRGARITTGDDSTAELSFQDQTVITLGENTSLLLDDMVLVQQASIAERFFVSLSVGAMRFVSGIQPPETYGIITPTLNIGVRGTTLDVVVDDQQVTSVVLRDGELELRNGSSVVRRLRTPGHAVISRRPDAAPSLPARAPAALERRFERFGPPTLRQPQGPGPRPGRQPAPQGEPAPSSLPSLLLPPPPDQLRRPNRGATAVPKPAQPNAPTRATVPEAPRPEVSGPKLTSPRPIRPHTGRSSLATPRIQGGVPAPGRLRQPQVQPAQKLRPQPRLNKPLPPRQ